MCNKKKKNFFYRKLVHTFLYFNSTGTATVFFTKDQKQLHFNLLFRPKLLKVLTGTKIMRLQTRNQF